MSTTESPMTVTSIAPWFGAKRTLAPRIVAELGDHRAYWEIFCGSMAVLMAKPPASMETVNDLHDDLINLARCLQHRVEGPKLYRKSRRVLCSQAEFEQFAAIVKEELAPLQSAMVGIHPGRALAYFVTSWLGMNGVAGLRSNHISFSRRYTKNGGHSAKRFAGAVDSIPAWRRRLRAVTVLSSCGIELAEKIEDAEGVVIYADPPYLVKGAKYLHDFEDGFMGPNDHERLATALRRFKKTRVVVSYYAHPGLAAMYPGWTVVDVATTKSLVSSGRRDEGNDIKAPEVLLINGPSLTKGVDRG